MTATLLLPRKERGLSIVKELSAKQRYHRAEYGLAKRGEMSWKDEIREVITHERKQSKTYNDFKKNITEKYNIEVKERGKHINFKHPDHQKFVRGKTLGLDYERGTIENGFDRQIERGASQEQRATDLSSTKRTEIERTTKLDEGNQRTQQTDAGIHKGTHERGHSNQNDNRPRVEQDKNYKPRNTGETDFDFDKARNHAEKLRQQTSSAYGQWQNRDEREQSNDHNQNERNREYSKNRIGKNEQQHGKQLKITRGEDFFPSR